jgi:energy-coupling factor transporter ATP-binding protein EcfA2
MNVEPSPFVYPQTIYTIVDIIYNGNPDKMIAVVGPEGSGKSEYCQTFDKLIVHAAPRTSKWKSPDSKLGRIFYELAVAAERFWVYIKLEMSIETYDNIMLDNCFIDSEVYGQLWSVKVGSILPLFISKFLSNFSPKPDVIHQLSPSMTLNESDNDLLEGLYIFALKRHGYIQYNQKQYKEGVLTIWKKDLNSSSIVERKRN